MLVGSWELGCSFFYQNAQFLIKMTQIMEKRRNKLNNDAIPSQNDAIKDYEGGFDP